MWQRIKNVFADAPETKLLRSKIAELAKNHSLGIRESQKNFAYGSLKQSISESKACDRCDDIMLRTAKSWKCRGCGRRMIAKLQGQTDYYLEILELEMAIEELQSLSIGLPDIEEKWASTDQPVPDELISLRQAVNSLPLMQKYYQWAKTGK